jgi:hypoxanthine-DNA glycosylase
MPGDISLKLNQYYAHPRNRFWKILSNVTNTVLPDEYNQKLTFLSKHKIGLWDVVQSANRQGSLDNNIYDTIPNDINMLLDNVRLLK